MGSHSLERVGGTSRGSFRPACRVGARRAIPAAAFVRCFEPLEARAYLTVSLAPATDYPGVSSPAGIVTADFNGDGVADVALVGIDPTTGLHAVGIYLAGASPVFYDLTGDNTAQDITTGDFNGDTKPDLVVSDPVDGTINLLLGNGDGTFQTPITVSYGTAQPVGTPATAYLASADFNADSFPDLAITNPVDQRISILLGNGAGGFTLGTPITSTEPSFDPQHIVAANFNGDGFIDLAYNDGTAPQVNLIKGNNTGAFAAPIPLAVGGAVQGLAAADLNADGNTDLVASISTGGGTDAVDVLLNSGTAFSAAVAQPTTFANPGPVAIGDIDGDGKADIVTMSASGAIDLFLGNGDGTFAAATESQVTDSGTAEALVTADVNTDGRADILFSEINPAITDGGGFGLVLAPAAPELSVAIAGALPSSAVAGTRTRITQTLKLASISSAAVKGSVNISVALSADSSFSTDDAVIDTTSVAGNIAAGKTKTHQLKATDIPAGLTAGNYYVVVQVTDPSGGIATASSFSPIAIVSPQIDLSGTFKKAPSAAGAGKRLGASIIVTNNGNVPATGVLPIIVDTSTLNTLDDTAVQAISFNKKVNIKPGKSITIQLARLIAPTTGAAYYLIVQLDPNNALGDANPANNTFATATAIVVS